MSQINTKKIGNFMFRKVYLLLLLTFLIQNPVYAADVNAFCYTAIGGTTTFIIKTENNSVNFEVINHNGGKYAPFWSSLVVPNDLSTLSKKAEIIQKIDRGFAANWKPKQCKWMGENKFSCIGSTEKINVNGLEIEPWALYSSVITDSSFAGDYKYIEMSVSFVINEESFNYTMRYPEDECLLSENRIEKKK